MLKQATRILAVGLIPWSVGKPTPPSRPVANTVNTVVNTQDGRYENSTPEDMAVGLLLSRKARDDPPTFTEQGGKTLMKGIEVGPMFELNIQNPSLPHPEYFVCSDTSKGCIMTFFFHRHPAPTTCV